jgi:hypothetical protein
MRWITAFAVLAAITAFGAQPTFAQGTERAFCLTGASSTSPQGSIPECRYDTMAQCQEAAKGQATARCGPNPKMATKK